jgi:uncharacterized membrane protein
MRLDGVVLAALDAGGADATAAIAVAAHILHVLAAVTLVGGLVYLRFVLLPAEKTLPPDQGAELAAAARARWSKWVAASALFLLASGLYSIARISMQYQVPSWYHVLFGVKFLLALLIFFLSSILAGRTAAAERYRERMTGWMNLNVGAAAVVIIIAGVLANVEKVPKSPSDAIPAQTAPMAP